MAYDRASMVGEFFNICFFGYLRECPLLELAKIEDCCIDFFLLLIVSK